MKVRRSSYQKGSVYLRRGYGYWKWRDRSTGEHRTEPLGLCANKAEAWKKAQLFVLRVNGGIEPETGQATVKLIVKLYLESDRCPARFSTRRAYESYMNTHILPKWGNETIDNVKPYAVDVWLKSLQKSQKTKAHIKGLMHLLFEYAMFREFLPAGRNPMELVSVTRQTKRTRQSVNLTIDGFQSVLAHITQEPIRTMVLTTICTGLRFSELVGLKWSDVDWIESKLHVRRAVVRGHVDETKNRHSARPVPLDDNLIEVIKAWRSKSEFTAPEDWVFASPYTAGATPYAYTYLRRVIKAAGVAAGIRGLAWHAFRHSYRTWLGSTGAPVGVQQNLMRHADFRTTMNIYGDSLPDQLREVNAKVVKMALQKRSNGSTEPS